MTEGEKRRGRLKVFLGYAAGVGKTYQMLREAHELRMLNPRYAGVDRENRPYVVTSAIGRQASDRDDLMSLERPRAEMTMHNGALVVVTAATAMYQSQAQLLDLFGDVNLVHENGTRFVTNSTTALISLMKSQSAYVRPPWSVTASLNSTAPDG